MSINAKIDLAGGNVHPRGVIEFVLIGTVYEETMPYTEVDSEADEEDVDLPFVEVLKRRRCS